jgi:hypothetical protein
MVREGRDANHDENQVSIIKGISTDMQILPTQHMPHFRERIAPHRCRCRKIEMKVFEAACD